MKTKFLHFLVISFTLFTACNKEESDSYEADLNYEKATIIKEGIPIANLPESLDFFEFNIHSERQPLLINSSTDFEAFMPEEEYEIDKNVDFNTQSIIVTLSHYLPTREYYEYKDIVKVDSISKTISFRTACNQYGNKINNTTPSIYFPALNIFILPKINDSWTLSSSISTNNRAGDLDLIEYVGNYSGVLKTINSTNTEVENITLSATLVDDNNSQINFSIPLGDSTIIVNTEVTHKYQDKLVLTDWYYSHNVDVIYGVHSLYRRLVCIFYNDKIYIKFKYKNPTHRGEDLFFEFIGSEDFE